MKVSVLLSELLFPQVGILKGLIKTTQCAPQSLSPSVTTCGSFSSLSVLRLINFNCCGTSRRVERCKLCWGYDESGKPAAFRLARLKSNNLHVPALDLTVKYVRLGDFAFIVCFVKFIDGFVVVVSFPQRSVRRMERETK